MGRDGNYWGHNAIIRTRAFADHCGMPDLPGRPPFGGHILSHDFVEAALMRRAGWAVYMLPTLGGSVFTVEQSLAAAQKECVGASELECSTKRRLEPDAEAHQPFG